MELILALVPQITEDIVEEIVTLVPQINSEIAEPIQHVPQGSVQGFIVEQIVAPVPQTTDTMAEAIQCAPQERAHQTRTRMWTSLCLGSKRKSCVFQAPAPVAIIISLAPVVFHSPALVTVFSPVPAVLHVPVPAMEFVSPSASAKLGARAPHEIVDELQRRGERVPSTIVAARDKLFRGALGPRGLHAARAVDFQEAFLSRAPYRWERPWPHTA